jgi:hypothetical protein
MWFSVSGGICRVLQRWFKEAVPKGALRTLQFRKH